MTMIEMVVEGIGIDPRNQPLVLLRDEGRKTFVPIWIGPAEAVSIQWELDNRQPQRPMTHDLINNIFNQLDIRLIKVSVNDVSDQIFYATLHLQFGRSEDIHEVDARPSDAIALALRAHCQIWVSDSVAQKTGIQIEEAEEGAELADGEERPASNDEINRFVKLLEGVDLSGESESN